VTTQVPLQQLFREEALQTLQRGADDEGDLLRISPAWTRWAYWVLVAAVLAALAYGVLGTVNEYAPGPAVVRVAGRVDVTATSGGTVVAIDVQPGQRVARGQTLVRFHDASERAELARLDQELEAQLVKLLRDPADRGARESLTSLRAQRDLAEARMAERSLRAPAAGVVSDVRIRPGQPLGAGSLAVSLIRDDAQFSLLAFLPGNARPLLKIGMPLRMELMGFAYSYQELTIDALGDEVVGPAEAKRFLGPDLGDALALSGPVVLVKANLPRRTFTSDGRTFHYYDGTPAVAEARVRRRPILVAIIPALRRLWGDDERGPP